MVAGGPIERKKTSDLSRFGGEKNEIELFFISLFVKKIGQG